MYEKIAFIFTVIFLLLEGMTKKFQSQQCLKQSGQGTKKINFGCK